MSSRVRCAPVQALTAIAVLGLLGLGIALNRSSDPVSGPDEVVLRGVALAMHPEASAQYDLEYPPSVRELGDLGARAVLVPIAVLQEDLRSTEVGAGPMTPRASDIRSVIRRAHRRGLSTVIMPFLVLNSGPPTAWRGRIAPADPAAWWTSYRALILGYARIAAEEDVAVLVIGSELTSMFQMAEPWAELAQQVRAVYGGRLALVANHDALDVVAPFEHVDIAGVSAYFSLTDTPEATQEDLHNGWRRVLPKLHAFAGITGKPLVVFEVGYPSVDGGAVQPWNYLSGGPVDLQEQAWAYAAAIDALQQPWIEGVFFWTWFGSGGRFDRTYTPRDKPALQLLQRFFTERGS